MACSLTEGFRPSSLNSTRIPALDKSSHKLPVSCSNLTKVNSQTQGFGISQASINVSAPLIMTNDSTASSFSQYNQSTSNSTYVYAVQSAISSELARASSSPSMISDTFGLNDTTNGTSMFPSGNMTQYSDNSSTSQNYQPKSSTCTDLMRIFCQEAQGSKPPQYCLTICAASLPANTSALNSTYGSPLASSNPRPQGPAKDQPNAPGSQKPNTNAIKGWTWR